MPKNNYIDDGRHSEDLQEIIAKPPSWLLQWGISLVVLTVLLTIGGSFFIRYPNIVHANLKFTTKEAPKAVVAKVHGRLVRLLVPDETWVTNSTPLAYLESTADHDQVLTVLDTLNKFRKNIFVLDNLEEIFAPSKLNLGELQAYYQNFYITYLNFRAIFKEGIFNKRRKLILEEIANIDKQKYHIQESYELQKKELALAEEEYMRFKILAEKKVISPMELQHKEALLLVKRKTIPQMKNNIITNRGSTLNKDKELAEIDNDMRQELKKFMQSLNSFISEGENWKNQYVLTSPITGKLVYSSFLQDNQHIKAGEEVFYINPINEEYYAEMYIPQEKAFKVQKGQDVMIKVHGYPHLEFGYIIGRITYLSDIPIRDSVFFSKVDLVRSDQDSLIRLKPGIYGDAEIITEDQSVFKRIWLNLTKSLSY